MKKLGRIYLSIGTNVGELAANLSRAIELLKSNNISIITVSSVYKTPPWGKTDQGAFLNIVLAVEAERRPLELLDVLQSVEKAMGRIRREKWEPRIIDIDILAYGDFVIDTDEVTIPHKFLKERAFVLMPFAEIAPSLVLPDETWTIKQLLSELPAEELSGIEKLDIKLQD